MCHLVDGWYIADTNGRDMPEEPMSPMDTTSANYENTSPAAAAVRDEDTSAPYLTLNSVRDRDYANPYDVLRQQPHTNNDLRQGQLSGQQSVINGYQRSY